MESLVHLCSTFALQLAGFKACASFALHTVSLSRPRRNRSSCCTEDGQEWRPVLRASTSLSCFISARCYTGRDTFFTYLSVLRSHLEGARAPAPQHGMERTLFRAEAFAIARRHRSNKSASRCSKPCSPHFTMRKTRQSRPCPLHQRLHAESRRRYALDDES